MQECFFSYLNYVLIQFQQFINTFSTVQFILFLLWQALKATICKKIESIYMCCLLVFKFYTVFHSLIVLITLINDETILWQILTCYATFICPQEI